jgi:hypothetical protein
LTSPQRERHSVAAIRNRSRIGDELVNIARIKAHLRQIVPQHLFAIVVLIFATDPLQTHGKVNGLIIIYSVAKEYRARQFEESVPNTWSGG